MVLRRAGLKAILGGPKKTMPSYRIVMASLFTTCPYRCGFCKLAESGAVLDHHQLKPYKDPTFVNKIAAFFNSRTTPKDRWHLHLTGGEPLMMPNIALFCEELFRKGNIVSFDTNLAFHPDHQGFRFLLESDTNSIDYLMASFQPEAETDRQGFFEKIRLLKNKGHKIFVRFVGHPKRLHLLEDLAKSCRELDVAFYPTALLSRSYPHGYGEEHKQKLQSYASSISQILLLEGSIDTTDASCLAGSKNIAVDFHSGAISPCVLLPGVVIGNIHENRMVLDPGPRTCPAPGLACNCDVHYQQEIVCGISDAKHFDRQKRGYIPPLSSQEVELIRRQILQSGLSFSQNRTNIGQTKDESILVFGSGVVKEAFKEWERKYYSP